MGTKIDTTTADFDAGTKSQSTSNREVITVTDAVSAAQNAPAADELQLENLYSDKFDIADADALTAKWKVGAFYPGTGTRSANINTTVANKLRINCGAAGAVGTYSLANQIKLTGDFSVQCKLDASGLLASNYNNAALYIRQDATNWSIIAKNRWSGGNIIDWMRYIGGVYTEDVVSTADMTIAIRLRRVGTTLYAAYDLAEGEAWTEWTKLGGFAGDVEVGVYLYCATTNGVRYANFSDFKIKTGTLLAGAYRTSGNFVGRTMDCGVNTMVTQLTINVNCPNNTTTLKNGANDALELYENDINDYASSAKVDGWTNAELLAAGMTEGGVNSTITIPGLTLGTKQYKWYKLYAIGSGAATVKIFDVTTDYAPTAPSAALIKSANLVYVTTDLSYVEDSSLVNVVVG